MPKMIGFLWDYFPWICTTNIKWDMSPYSISLFYPASNIQDNFMDQLGQVVAWVCLIDRPHSTQNILGIIARTHSTLVRPQCATQCFQPRNFTWPLASWNTYVGITPWCRFWLYSTFMDSCYDADFYFGLWFFTSPESLGRLYRSTFGCVWVQFFMLDVLSPYFLSILFWFL